MDRSNDPLSATASSTIKTTKQITLYSHSSLKKRTGIMAQQHRLVDVAYRSCSLAPVKGCVRSSASCLNPNTSLNSKSFQYFVSLSLSVFGFNSVWGGLTQ